MSSEAPNNSTSATNDQMNDYNHVFIHQNTRAAVIDEHKKALKFIEDVTTNAAEVQRRVLYEILSTSAHVEYLQRHGLDGHTDPETFKKVIPVVTYEDLKPDIERIANGDTSPILCTQPISEFYFSSGTSGGQKKLIPTTEDEFGRASFFRSLEMPIINQFISGLDKGKGMYFRFIKPEEKTPGGLVASSISTARFKSLNFKETSNHDPCNNYTSPHETVICEDLYQSMYSQLLCGLYQNKQVLRVGAIFTYGLVLMVQFLQEHWTLLCNDIRTGTIDAKITDQSVREAVLKILVKPDPKLADFIETQCTRDRSWKGIISRLWPNTKYIDAIATGTMSQYIPSLDYFSNGLPVVSPKYAASEGYFGLNLEPLCKPNEVSYSFIPSMAYFEFFPVDRVSISSLPSFLDQEQQEELVDLVDVKLGEEYEIVVNTYAGLYRYRLGDRVRIAGFKNNTPQFNFICRNNVTLCIDGEKTKEVELQDAVKNAVKHLIPFKASLYDYTSSVDTSTIPSHYVIYWELRQDGATSTSIPPSIFEECCFTIEESLNSIYHLFRFYENSIGPLEIKIVETGSFDKLRDYAISRGASISQYKTPRCVKYASLVDLLNSGVLSNYFSPKCPK